MAVGIIYPHPLKAVGPLRSLGGPVLKGPAAPAPDLATAARNDAAPPPCPRGEDGRPPTATHSRKSDTTTPRTHTTQRSTGPPNHPGRKVEHAGRVGSAAAFARLWVLAAATKATQFAQCIRARLALAPGILFSGMASMMQHVCTVERAAASERTPWQQNGRRGDTRRGVR